MSASFARNPVVDAALEPAVHQPDGTLLIHYNRPVLTYSLKDDLGNPVQAASWEATLDDDLPLVSPLHPMPASGQPFAFNLTSGDHKIVITGYDQAGHTYSQIIRFTLVMAPFTITPDLRREGDLIGVYADATGATGNANGSWDDKTWEWSITREGQEPFTFTGPVGFYALPTKEDEYSIHLVTTDSATGAICVEDQSFTPSNRAPRVSALDVEVPFGRPAHLLGRFLDPAWINTHTAEWKLTSPSGTTVLTPQAAVAEDNLKAMDSGTVTGTTGALDVAGTWQGELTVSTVGSSEEPTVAEFTVTVRSQEQTGDPNDADGNSNDAITRPASSPVLGGGQTYLSYIQSAGDVDVYEIRTPDPDNELLPYGTEVLVNLVSPPADYDLALVEDLGADASPNAGLGGTSFPASSAGESTWNAAGMARRSPLAETPFIDTGMARRSPLAESPYMDAGMARRSPLAESAYLDAGMARRSPLTNLFFLQSTVEADGVNGYSFNDISGTGIADATDSGSSIRFEELGLDNGGLQNYRVVGYSAHPGNATETLLTTTDYVGGHLYALVKGADRASDAEHPYTLQVETSLPLNLPEAMNAGSEGSVLVKIPTTATDPVIQQTQRGPVTLYVTQAQRLNALYADPAAPAYRAFEDTVLPALEHLFTSRQDDPSFGDVISLPSVIYDEWDRQPWNVELGEPDGLGNP